MKVFNQNSVICIASWFMAAVSGVSVTGISQGDHSPKNLEKSWNSKVVRENGKSQGKVRGSEIRCVFQALNTPKLIFWPGLCPDPAGGAYDAPPDCPVGWGGGHPVRFPQLLQPQLLNNWLSGLTLFFTSMKQRLLTISVNTRYRVIFACLYWKSQGKVGEFHVVWKVVIMISRWMSDCMYVWIRWAWRWHETHAAARHLWTSSPGRWTGPGIFFLASVISQLPRSDRSIIFSSCMSCSHHLALLCLQTRCLFVSFVTLFVMLVLVYSYECVLCF